MAYNNLPNRVEDTLLNRVYVFSDHSGKWRWHIEDPATKRPGTFVSEPTVQAAYVAAAARAAQNPQPGVTPPVTPRPTIVPTPAAAPAPAAAQPTPTPTPTSAAQPAAQPQARQATPVTPQTANPTPSGAGQPQKENVMSFRNVAAIAAVLALVIVGLYFLLRTNSSGTTIASTSVLTVDDLDGRIDGRIKRAIDPVKEQVGKLDKRTTDMSDAIGTLDSKLVKTETNVLAGIKDVLERLNKVAPGASTPAPTGPAMSATQQQRLALVKRECLPEDQNVDLSETAPLSDEAFNAHIADCKAKKLAKQRMVSPPPAANGPQVAQGDPQADEVGEEDEREGGQPTAQPVGYGYGGPQYGRPGYGPGYGAPHHGMRRGGPRCPPGSNFNPQYGKCIGTVLRHVPLHPEARAVFPTCADIETRTVWKNGRLTQQQRGVDCRRPAY